MSVKYGKVGEVPAAPSALDDDERVDVDSDDSRQRASAPAAAPLDGVAHDASTAASVPNSAAAATTAQSPSPPPASSPYPAICFWIIMSCTVILFNKHLYNGAFPYPLTLTCIHMLFATCATWTLRFLGYIESPKFGWVIWSRTVIPIGILYATSLATSNLGAQRLSVSFVQMIKALTPLVTLGASVLMQVEKADRRQALIVGVMCLGVIVASHGEILWHTLGVFFQVTSVAAEGSRLVVTQILLQQHLPKSNPLVSISIFAPPCFALLLPIALTFEDGALAALGADAGTGFTVLLNTLTAFVLNLAVVILVQKSSGLVLTLAGIVKDIVLIVASIFIFGNPVTPIQVLGYALALLGLNLYNEYKTHKADDTGMLQLLRTAVTNRQAAFIVVGSLVLLAFSLRSLSAYYAAASGADAANADADATAMEARARRAADLLLTL